MGCCYSQVTVSGDFLLEVQVLRVNDSVNDCGGGFDVCDLYIDELCLDSQSEAPGSVEEGEACSLAVSTDDLDLEEGLPRTGNLSAVAQPWPVCS